MGSKLSNGDYIDGDKAKRLISKAKEMKTQSMMDQNFCHAYGWNIHHPECEELDWSHIVSVADCKKYGKTEFAWHPDNLERESRKAHIEWENTPHKCQHHFNYRRKIDFMKEHFPEVFNKRIAAKL